MEGQVLRYLGGRTYEVAISGQGVRVVQEQALSLRIKGERRYGGLYGDILCRESHKCRL
jgi:hypothetical protein